MPCQIEEGAKLSSLCFLFQISVIHCTYGLLIWLDPLKLIYLSRHKVKKWKLFSVDLLDVWMDEMTIVLESVNDIYTLLNNWNYWFNKSSCCNE